MPTWHSRFWQKLSRGATAPRRSLREPFVLFALEDKSQPHIAAQMQCNIKAVEMRLYQARTRLHDELGKQFRENEGFGFLRRSRF